MKVISLRDQVKQAAEIWLNKYGWNSGHYDRLRLLDTETATLADVKTITADYPPGWIEDGLTCNECGNIFLFVVQVGINRKIEIDDNDWDWSENITNRLCPECLRKALTLLEATGTTDDTLD